MSDGNWRVGLIMDDGASEEQTQALGAVFGGEKGGPMELIAPLIGEMLGLEHMPIEYEDDGFKHRVKAGDGIDFEIEDIVPEGFSEPSRLTGSSTPRLDAHGRASDALEDPGLRNGVRQRRQERPLRAVLLGCLAAAQQLLGIEDLASASEGVDLLPRDLVGDRAVRCHFLSLPLVECVEPLVPKLALETRQISWSGSPSYVKTFSSVATSWPISASAPSSSSSSRRSASQLPFSPN